MFVGNHRKYTDRPHIMYSQLFCGSNSVVSAGVLPMVPDEHNTTPPTKDRVAISFQAMNYLVALAPLELHAALVDVKARLHVVQCVADAVQVGPKVLVELVLRVGRDLVHPRLHMHPWVHRLSLWVGAGVGLQ